MFHSPAPQRYLMARQRQQTGQTQSQPAVSRGTLSFTGGVMAVDGRRQQARRSIDRLSSNEITTYTAVEWDDPVTHELRYSCNCPGYTRRLARDCKHCQELRDNPGLSETATIQRVTTSGVQAPFRAGTMDQQSGKRTRGLSL